MVLASPPSVGATGSPRFFIDGGSPFLGTGGCPTPQNLLAPILPPQKYSIPSSLLLPHLVAHTYQARQGLGSLRGGKIYFGTCGTSLQECPTAPS